MERLKFESGCHAGIILQLPAKRKGDYRELTSLFRGWHDRAKGKRQKAKK